QNSLVCRLRIDRLLARPRLVLQAFQAMVGIAMPPKADDPGLDPNFLGDRPRAASGRRQKNYPRPLQIALQRHRRATARLKHLAIFPRKVDFSRFGYHPYLESRLTIQEKWVLGEKTKDHCGQTLGTLALRLFRSARHGDDPAAQGRPEKGKG